MDIDYSFTDYSFINFTGTESLLTTSQYAKVIFYDIQEKYPINEDLVCQYSLTEQFTAKAGDRIVLFRLGWQDITDYVIFEWASLPQENVTLSVKFKADCLPKDTNEFYQLCYISKDNAVCGASVPFQFVIEGKNYVTPVVSDCFQPTEDVSSLVLSYTNTINDQSGSLETDSTLQKQIDISNTACLLDVAQLKEENMQLKEDLIKTATTLQLYNTQINDLKIEVESLKSTLQDTRSEVADLRMRMDTASAEYKNVYVEKVKMEKKYDKLVKKCQSKNKRSLETDSDLSLDALGELEPLPPFPLLM